MKSHTNYSFNSIFQVSCRICKCKFPNRSELFKHRKIHHNQIGHGLQEFPFNDHDDAPWIMSDGSVDIQLKEEYILNKDIILHEFEEGVYIFSYYPNLFIK